jgi:hypothetical protein
VGISPTELEIRPIEPRDKASLAAAVDESRDEAVYRRFLNPHGRLADNRPMRALLAVLGPTRLVSSEAGAVELAVDL